MRIKIAFCLLWIGMLAVSVESYAQDNIVVTGIVTDSVTHEPLAGATLYVKKISQGVVTDENGEFSLRFPPGSALVVSYVGYQTKTINLSESKPDMNIRLFSQQMLGEVVVTSRKTSVASVMMGVEKLDMPQIKKMPALMGEVDIIKAIQLLPNVQPTSEGGSGFSVRGASPDQNLILLDNATIYNASHFIGFFSVFNNDIISGLELYKGDIPVKYGGRLSSLLDVKTLEEAPERFTGTGGLGLISSRLMLQGPVGENTTWLIGGRRSYMDLFLRASSDKDINNTTLYFYDLNAKMTHRFSSKDKLSFNFYTGRDAFGADIFDFRYGNLASTLSLGHTIRENLYSNFSLNVSDYKYGIKTDIEGGTIDWRSSITDAMLRADFSHDLNPQVNLSYGLTSTVHNFNPGDMKSKEMSDYKVPETYALEHGLYLSNEQKMTEDFTLRYGLRYALFQNVGKIRHEYHRFDPRVGAVYLLPGNSSVKANYARNTQFLQMASVSSVN
ncbi:MAG: TonB-dependent receptor, partial [Tannerella sp.]|nr:TonB-dependent receptor [Tannerella sp.]